VVPPLPAIGEEPAAGWTPPAATPAPIVEIVEKRPEVAAGGAFAGGLVLALILKRLAR
jgi:hypothetical protein